MNKSYKIMSIMLALLLSFSMAAPVAEAGFMDGLFGLFGFGGENDAPVAHDIEVEILEGQEISIHLNVTDENGDLLEYGLSDMPANGTAVLEEGTNIVIYTSTLGFIGEDNFTYYGGDGEYQSNIATVTINVTPAPVNNPPVAYDLSVETEEDSPISITLNATDADGDVLNYSVSNASNGAVSINEDVATYNPTTDFVGSDSFTYYVSDETNNSNTATVTINVTEVIDSGFTTISDFSYGALYLGEVVEGNITITNTGDTVQSFTITKEAKDDGESEDISLAISETQNLENIQPNASVEIAYTYTISDSQPIVFGEDMGYLVKVSNNVSTETLVFTSEIKSHLFDLDNFDLNPESDLNPGDSFDIEFDIENLQNFDVDDVEVRVTIINMELDGDDLEITSEFNLDDEETRDNEEFNFRVPYNIDETPNTDDRYSVEVYIKGYPDDDDTYHEETKVKFLFNEKIEVVKEEDDEVTITSLDITPLDPQCGSQMTITTTVVNTGDSDQREMYLKLTVNELDIIETSHPFELDSDNDDDREREEMFIFTIPGNSTDGDYVVKIWAYDRNDNLLGYDSKTMSVAGNCAPSTDDGSTDDGSDDDDDNADNSGVIDLQGADGSWPFSFITGAAISDLFGANGLKTTFWLLGVLALVIINIYFVLLLRRTSIKR